MTKEIYCSGCGRKLREEDVYLELDDPDYNLSTLPLCEQCSEDPGEFLDTLREQRNREYESGSVDARGFESDTDYREWQARQM